MQAYHGSEETKQFFIERMQSHIDADELITGDGWLGSKGCSVGCLFHKYDHSLGAELMGTPEWLHRLQDTIHESCSDEFRKTFSIRFLESIPVGKNVDSVKSHLLVFILERNKDRVSALDIDVDLKKQVIDAIDLSIILYTNEWSESAARSARSAAWEAESAAWEAESAAWSAARSAARSAESAAESAAGSAARSARSAARSAASAAESAAGSAARSAESAARENEIDLIGNKLIELLAE